MAVRGELFPRGADLCGVSGLLVVTGLSAAIWYFQLPEKLLLPWCGLFCVSECVVSASLICWAH